MGGERLIFHREIQSPLLLIKQAHRLMLLQLLHSTEWARIITSKDQFQEKKLKFKMMEKRLILPA